MENAIDAFNLLSGVREAYGESYIYDPASGNLANKAGQALSYNPSRPHAATGYNGSTYTYDVKIRLKCPQIIKLKSPFFNSRKVQWVLLRFWGHLRFYAGGAA
jgi:hypothetical protein